MSHSYRRLFRLRIAVLAMTIAPSWASGQIRAASPLPAAKETSFGAVPPLVIAGLDAYKRDGAARALDEWLRGSPAAPTPVVGQLRDMLAAIETSYGAFLGYEAVRAVEVSPHFRRVYAIMLYERGPLFAAFDCYLAQHEWVITGLVTNTKASEILPAAWLSAPPILPVKPSETADPPTS